MPCEEEIVEKLAFGSLERIGSRELNKLCGQVSLYIMRSSVHRSLDYGLRHAWDLAFFGCDS